MLSVCSFVAGECKPPIQYQETFDRWQHCVLTALDTSTKYLLAMDIETVNKFQLSTQYTCKQSKEI